MEAPTDCFTPTPLETGPATCQSHQITGNDRVDGTRDCPLQMGSCTVGTGDLSSALESLTPLLAPKESRWKQSNTFPAINPLMDKGESVSMSWGAEHDDDTAKLRQAESVNGEQRPFHAWSMTAKMDSGVGDGESVTLPFEATGEEERSTPGATKSKVTTASTKCDTSLVATLSRDFSGRWQPQGFLGGILEKFDAKSPKGGTSSMFAMVLNEDAPDDLPRAPSPYPEPHSHASTPLVNAIQLNRHCMTMTPFMSVSSIFAASVRSTSLSRTSAPHLMSSPQQCCATPTCSATQEVPLLGAAVGSEPRPICASPLLTGSALAQGALKKERLAEVTFVCVAPQESDSSGIVPFLDSSIISAANSTVTAHQASPRNPCAPTLPCTPVASSASTLPVGRCVLEEEQERDTIARDEASCLGSILAREVSAYLSRSRQERKAARQHREYIGATAKRNHLQNAARQFHEMMQARMRVLETEHEKALNTYGPAKPVPLLSVNERSPQTKSLEEQAERSDMVLPASAPPWQVAYDPCSAAPLDAQSSVDYPVLAEIQRQLRLGSRAFQKVDPWIAEAPFRELR
ncbi:hypothetical protein LSCM1_00125 [Leishmania martiniquensis]|uniref:Uncharacterized protein n=1 Tax=Leishmania martiniquensis TaxID=1580590 RepID=A0A836FY78_9TRYP|nr:hypothetical protein LSCM1_00125 [Leishmania martiniquensis]